MRLSDMYISKSRKGRVLETMSSVPLMFLFSPLALIWCAGKVADKILKYGEGIDTRVAHTIARKCDGDKYLTGRWQSWYNRVNN